MAATRKNASQTESNDLIPQFGYVFLTDLGWMVVAWQQNRLTRLTFGHPSFDAAAAQLPSDIVMVDQVSDISGPIGRTIERLQKFAAGAPDSFSDVPLALDHLTEFQHRVIKACRQIKAGKVRSYADLAAIAGSPRAARAVGNVMRSNRFPLIVPCHRVIGTSGKLCGFTSPQGLAMKEKLLQREGGWSQKVTAKSEVGPR